ncbi:MAG: hypothetical protein B5M48_03570 [Candidatus Omnitrophica bacterium 4484_213]|nr:MAG: hypothetical protein B5M48_03570 [Candidatus Omnitrophica bacterium 4484_213]
MLLLILRFLIKAANLLPFRFSLWLGKIQGRLAYFLSSHHRQLAYANIRFFLGKDRKEALRIVRGLFENLGVSLSEIFRFFRLNKQNIDSYVDFEGLKNLDAALSKGKGVILLTAHLGNWEISSVALSLKGYSMKVIARQQKNKRVDELLNFYRQSSGIKVIKRGMALRGVIQGLKNNEIVGILGDQGGKNKEVCVRFFGRYIFLPSGFLDIALKTGATVLPAFISRVILILDDGKAGHLNQSRAVATQFEKVQSEKYPEIFNTSSGSLKVIIRRVEYRNRLTRFLLTLCSVFASRRCAGCLKCLQFCLTKRSYNGLAQVPANIIISSGSSLIPPNIFLKQENFARNIAVMSPPKFLRRFFDLIIAPLHDHLQGRNTLSILGTPNLITPQAVEVAAKEMRRELALKKDLIIGVFIGNGSYSRFQKLLTEIIRISKRLDAGLLLTTSRRTSRQIEKLFKQRLADFSLCKLLVIANEENIDNAVAKILGLSNFVIISADSISMISEAASSGKPVIVVDAGKSEKKKKEFLRKLEEERIIDLVSPDKLEQKIIEVCTEKRKVIILNDKERIKEILEGLIN